MNKIECKLILNIGLNNSFLIKILHNIVFIVTLFIQFSYEINIVQLKLLQMSSLQANQRVTMHCQGMTELRVSFSGFKRGSLFRSSEHSNSVSLVHNSCSVSQQYVIFNRT